MPIITYYYLNFIAEITHGILYQIFGRKIFKRKYQTKRTLNFEPTQRKSIFKLLFWQKESWNQNEQFDRVDNPLKLKNKLQFLWLPTKVSTKIGFIKSFEGNQVVYKACLFRSHTAQKFCSASYYLLMSFNLSTYRISVQSFISQHQRAHSYFQIRITNQLTYIKCLLPQLTFGSK